MSEEHIYGFETLQVRGGYDPKKHNYASTVPIYQTASFNIGDTDRLNRIKSKEEVGFLYTRSGNPTIDILEKRITALEGGKCCNCCSIRYGSCCLFFIKCS